MTWGSVHGSCCSNIDQVGLSSALLSVPITCISNETEYTVCKMNFILRSIDRIQRCNSPWPVNLYSSCYNVKHAEKTAQSNFTFDAPCLEKTKQHRLNTNQRHSDPQPNTLPHSHMWYETNDKFISILFPHFTKSLILRIFKSKALILKFNVNLFLI